MKIGLLEPLGVSRERIEELAGPVRSAGHTFVYYDQKTTDIQELKRRSQGCDVVMIANNPYPAEVIDASEQLKMLNVAFTGIDHVGLEACRKRGVIVCNAANYSNQAVAELAIGMTIALLRKMTQADAGVRRGGTSAGLMGGEIAGRTVGIVGTGRIGMITAKLFKAFGAEVIAHSRTERQEAISLGIRYVPLDTLMGCSDIVSLHMPSNASTKGMIDRRMIRLMKPRALLINCARGPIVDAQALADALNEGRIAGAGIDVFGCEPPIPDDDPLLHAKNTLLTPHIAFLSEESMMRRAEIVFRNLYAYLDGKPENVCEG
ncbi:MAG: 2-hydroxyacid dehydrogenase [Clostridia bacterium]|nr:2-hydroxyacid dehydrogenase [Clostridia bacterium]